MAATSSTVPSASSFSMAPFQRRKPPSSDLAQKVSHAFRSLKFDKNFSHDVSNKMDAVELEAVLSECVHALYASNIEKFLENLTRITKVPLGKLQEAVAGERDLEQVLKILEATQGISLNQLQEAVDGEKDLKKMLRKLEKMASQISFDRLQDVVCIKDANQSKDLTLAAKTMLEEARCFLDTTDQKTTVRMTNPLRVLLDAILSFFDSLFAVFGVTDLFKPVTSQIDIQFKMGKVMMLASLFMMLSSTILPLFGVQTGGLIVGGSMLSLAVLSLIYRKIRPQVRELPEAVNLTKEIQEGNSKQKDVTGRSKETSQIAYTLSMNANPAVSDKIAVHAMLLGPSGAGKTETIYAFAQDVAKGEGEFAKFKGKTVYYFNTTKLVDKKDFAQGDNKILDAISDMIGKYSDDTILIFDEFHVTCPPKGSEKAPMGDQFKTKLDPKTKGKFPFVIALTTNDEFFRHILLPNPALARRFKKIAIGNTGEHETLNILNTLLLQTIPQVLIEKGAVKTLWQLTNRKQGAVQPGYALQILVDCVKELSESYISPISMQIQEIEGALQALHLTSAVEGTDKDVIKEIAKKEAMLKTLKEQLIVEKAGLKRLELLKTQRLNLKKIISRKIVQANQKAQAQSEKLMKMVYLCKFFLLPFLESQIQRQAKALKVDVFLDRKLIQRVIDKNTREETEVAELVAKGRSDFEQRSAPSMSPTASSGLSSTST